MTNLFREWAPKKHICCKDMNSRLNGAKNKKLQFFENYFPFQLFSFVKILISVLNRNLCLKEVAFLIVYPIYCSSFYFRTKKNKIPFTLTILTTDTHLSWALLGHHCMCHNNLRSFIPPSRYRCISGCVWCRCVYVCMCVCL